MSEKDLIVQEPDAIEKELSCLTDHLLGQILTLIDAVIENERQCEKTKDTVKGFFCGFRESKWKLFAHYRKVGQTN